MQHLVGGISSAGRIVPDMDGEAFLVERAEGSWVWDQKGRRYLDTALGFGATFLGHSHPVVTEAVTKAVRNGSMPAYAHRLEEEAAASLARHTGALSQVVFLNSGSEAVHLACRTARAATGRAVIAKLAAGYDGWFGEVAFGNAGSDAAAMRANSRPRRGDTVLTRFNDLDDAARLFAEEPDLAAILVEPVMANAGCIAPDPDYLRGIARMAREAGALVIADEVLMGFRLRRGLASVDFGLEPDLASLGKAIGNGFAVAALVGTREATAALRDGRLKPAGTYNGNPVACAAILATMDALEKVNYPTLLAKGDELRAALTDTFAKAGIPFVTTGFGTVFTPWRAEAPPRNYAEAVAKVDPAFTLALHRTLRRHGVMSMPTSFGRHYIATTYDDEAQGILLSAFAKAARDFAD